MNDAVCIYLVARSRVLIDTWWNVNSEKMKESARAGSVLIDTWWNVNIFNNGEGVWGIYCFNRYMVECEFATRNSRVASADGFNRYMVECEFGFGGIPVKASRVLIDTWWNVNTAD